MPISACSICWMRDDRLGAMRKASAAGFKAIELLTMPVEVWNIHGDLRTLKPADLRRELDGHGLELAALHLGAIMTPTTEKWRITTDYLKRAIEFAREIGCNTIVEGGPDRTSEPFEPFLESLDEIAPLLDGSPVRIALENHYGNSIQGIEDYERIYARCGVPNMGMALDTGHFTSAKVDPVEVARRFLPRVFHVHVKDHIGTESVALGEGQTDNFGVARVLNAGGFRGYYSQELEIHDATRADAAAAEGLAYMRRLLEC